MKKVLLVILIAASCTNAFAQKTPVIKSEADSVAYAYGVTLAQQGLQQYLVQLGVIADTAAVKDDFLNKIAEEADEAKKKNLEKQMQARVDSTAKANKASISKFIEGFTERFKEEEKKAPYFEGIALGGQVVKMIDPFSEQLFGKESKEKINKDLVLSGLTSVLKDETPLFDNAYQLIEQKMNAAQEKSEAEREVELRAQNEDVIRQGERFLNENKARPNVVTLPSGLQYQILTEGAGPKPTINDRVRVHYTGTLLNGTVFDSSVERGEPAVFGVGQVIKGWTEALQLMPVGSKWKLFIPYDLAYGAREAGRIPPFSTLVFEVELFGIE